ncbi:MAG: proline dehydrogenase family protein [Chitinophagales bacterium]
MNNTNHKKQPSISFANSEIAFATKSNFALRKMQFLFEIINRQALVKIGTTLTEWALRWHLPIKPLIKYTIFEQFCGGETLVETQNVVDKLGKANVLSLLDYGVEGKKNEAAFDETVKQITAAINYAKVQKNILAVSSKLTGLGRFELFEKVNRKEALNEKEKQEYSRVKKRLHLLCEAAQKANMSIYFDAEESWIQDALDSLIMEMMEQYNKSEPVVYNTIQLYRHDKLAYLKKCYEEAQAKKYLLAVKLVRGAYMEKERLRAKQKNYPSPIQPTKAATDADYNAALTFCIENIKDIAFCNASHNEASNLYLCELVEKLDLKPSNKRIVFGQLYGMSDNISFNLAAAGYNVAKYLPYGAVAEVVPYLIRRANENTSVAGQVSRELNLIREELKRRQR